MKYVLLLGLGVCFWGCGISPDTSKFIPRNASYVASFHLPTLLQKMEKTELFFGSFVFRDWQEQHLTLGDYLQKNWQYLGLQRDSRVHLFGLNTDSIAQNYTALVFKIDNEASFDRFLRNASSKGISLRSHLGVRYVILDRKTILGWANQVVFLVQKPKDTDDKTLLRQLMRLRDLPPSESLKSQNLQFRRLQEGSYDVALFLNLENYYSPLQQFLRRFLVSNLDLRQNYLTIAAQFHQGEASLDIHLHNLNRSLATYERVFRPALGADIFASIPANPMLVLGIGLDNQRIADLYRSSGLELWLNLLNLNISERIGMPTTEAAQALSGETAFALKDVRLRDGISQVEWQWALGVKQMPVIQRVIDFWGNQVSEKLTKSTLEKRLQANKLLMGTRDALPDDSVAASKDRLRDDLIRLGKKSCLVAFVDMRNETRQRFPGGFLGLDPRTEAAFKYSKLPVESLALEMQAPKNNIVEGKVVLGFHKRDQNALKSLLLMPKPF